MNNYLKQYKIYQEKVEIELKKQLKNIKNKTYPTLYLALEYSLMSGGKRVRPILMLAAAEACGLHYEDALCFAASIEMIHAYSLIHDDLPCMDNDDLRRGKPTNHKVFGEANAVLAGDALLNLAYETIFKECLKGNNYALAAMYLAESSGALGMISGQCADLDAQDIKGADENLLNYIHTHKTAKLLSGALAVPAILAGGKDLQTLEDAAHYIGLIFQYTDDILDYSSSKSTGKSSGKDLESNKLTIIKLKGIEKAQAEVEKLIKSCQDILKADKFWFIKEFARNLANRTR